MKSENNILLEFGIRIRQLREARGISQEELAHKAELHRTYIGMIERAEKNITLKNISKLASALEVELSDLFKVSYDSQ